MRILVPVNSPNEVSILNPEELGTEFFCGYMPQWWRERHNNSSSMVRGIIPAPINNRNGESANVMQPESLLEIVNETKRFGANLYLAINAKHYPGFLYDDLEKYIDEAFSLGVRRVIACDDGLIQFLGERYPEIKVSVSCLNQVTNSWSARRFLRLGNVERIVFPRHMAAKEMRRIALSTPELEFEFFIFSNKCVFDDGHCRGVHDFTPICRDHLEISSSAKDTVCRRRAIDSFLEYGRIEDDYVAKGLRCPNFSCAACSLEEVRDLDNVVSVKIAFRGHEIEKRLWQVRLARELIDMGTGVDDIQRLVSSVYGDPELCNSGMACMC